MFENKFKNDAISKSVLGVLESSVVPEPIEELSKKTLASYAKKASSSSDERSASNLSSRAAIKLAQSFEDGKDDGEKEDKKSFQRSKGIGRAIDRLAKEEVEQVDEIFHKVPNTKAAWDYMDKKREVRDDEHKKQDPKMAKHYAKNMVDTAKAAKKAKERGIKKDANDFGWQVRNGVQRGKLPEEVEPIDEAQEIHGVYKGPGNTMAFHNKNYKEPGVKHEILWHDGNKVTHTSKHDSTEDVHKTLTSFHFVKEDKYTETKDASGKVTSWSQESDWKKSTGKQGQGKVKHLSDLARRKTAKLATEEVEQVDELSKKTLGSYVKAASKDAEASGRDQEHYGDQSDYDRGAKRQKGISKAVDKLTKEEVEPLDEREESPTKGTRKVASYGDDGHRAEVRYNPEYQEYQVHHYKDGKHQGEGPVSYHGDDKEDAHDTAKYSVSVK